MEEEGRRVVASGRAVIDTRAPFKSVKEAVALFGERVLAGELYAKHLQEMQSECGEHTKGPSNYRTIAAELEETKQSLEQVLEENDAMTNTLESLKLELNRAKADLAKLQEKEKTTEVEIEEVKFIEQAKDVKVVIEPQIEKGVVGTERTKSVKFANHPHSLARAMAICDNEQMYKKKNKKQKKMVHPLVGWFMGKKSSSSSQTCRSSKKDVIHSAYI